MTKPRQRKLPAGGTTKPRDEDTFLIRSAESLGRVIGSLQRHLTAATHESEHAGRKTTTRVRAKKKTAKKKTVKRTTTHPPRAAQAAAKLSKTRRSTSQRKKTKNSRTS